MIFEITFSCIAINSCLFCFIELLVNAPDKLSITQIDQSLSSCDLFHTNCKATKSYNFTCLTKSADFCFFMMKENNSVVVKRTQTYYRWNSCEGVTAYILSLFQLPPHSCCSPDFPSQSKIIVRLDEFICRKIRLYMYFENVSFQTYFRLI